MHRVIACFYLLITFVLGVSAQDNVEQLDLRLKNQKYQALPTEIYEVFADQSERVWHRVRFIYSKKPFGVPECKAEIKAQFGKKQPILKLCAPVLFGPGKMIWFRPMPNPGSPGLSVIGYDGTTFIDYESTKEATIYGSLSTPTAQFFNTGDGVLVYHKKEFSHRYLGHSGTRMSYDPKSKQVLVAKGAGPRGDGRALESAYLWKDGTWTELDLPKPPEKPKSKKDEIIIIEDSRKHTPEPKREPQRAFFHQGSVQFLLENTPVTLGKYTCKSPELLCYHENDMYLTVKEIFVDNKSLGPGIVTVKADGSYAALPLKNPPTFRGKYESPVSTIIRNGKMWCYIDGTTCLLDLKTGKIVDRLEKPYLIHAVSGNRVYFGFFQVYVYQSGAPETRQALPVLKTIKSHDGGEFSEDGIFYVPVPTKHKTVITRKAERITVPSEYRYDYYDGKEWHELPNLRFKYPMDCMIGRNHTMIDTRGKDGAEWRFLKDGKVIDSNTFYELVHGNKDMISQNISDGRLGGGGRIVTTGPNQIWALGGSGLKALSGDEWMDIDAELEKKALERGYFTKLDNGRIYLTAFSRDADRRPKEYKGFVASIDNGKLRLQPAPYGHGAVRNTMYGYLLNVRDPKSLWLNAVDSEESGNSYHGKPAAIRISSKGVLQTIKHKGRACLYDEIGNVWIGIRSPYCALDKGIYHIWRDGKIVSSFRIPGANQMSAFFSDKPGSVYVSTYIGIHHYAINPKDPTTYSLDKTYYVPSLEGSVTFSKRGFMVFGAGYNPSIVALPKK